MAKAEVKKTGNTALDAVMSQIRKEFGEMSIMRLGDQEVKEIPVISTGAVSLDMALGVGGLPRGRIVECYGHESSGKTTLALHVVANAQKAGGIAAFIDAEHALDPVYARNLGVNIDELMNSLMDNYSREIELKRLKKVLTNTSGPTPLLFKTDGDKLTIVVSNLLCNAINFNRPDRKVEISYGIDENGNLKISVIDEGLGISPENQKIIYDRFRRLDSGINSLNRGHGLGLSINKAYIDFLGGTLELESKENVGAKFVVTIPESQMVSNDYSDEANEVFFGGEEIF